MRGETERGVGNPIGWTVLLALALHGFLAWDPIPLLILMTASVVSLTTTFQK